MHALPITFHATAELDALVAGLTANPAVREFRIQHDGVLEELSRVTGSQQPVCPRR